MLRLSVLDALSSPGRSGGTNEDRFGATARCAFVVDGATGLGDSPLMTSHGSDAAWFADHAARHLVAYDAETTDIRTAIAGLAVSAADVFRAAAGRGNPPRYAWPSASFAAVYRDGTSVSFCALADCVLYLRDHKGVVRAVSPMPEFANVESGWAARHIARSGGIAASGSLLRDRETLDDLRAKRSMQNTDESGVWTLGLVPEAADHLFRADLTDAVPMTGLLCSDGFSALVDSYGAHTPETLLATAVGGGLAPLFTELRHIEREVDPSGRRYPRFKQSDDATALLFQIS